MARGETRGKGWQRWVTYGRMIGMTTSPWLTRAQVATRLNVSERTVTAMVARGALTRHRIAGTGAVRFDVAEVDALVRPASAEDDVRGG